MTTSNAVEQTEKGMCFDSFSKAWEIEIADMDDRFCGNEPNSFEAKFSSLGNKIESKLGVDKNAQMAILSIIPGGTATAAVAGIAGIVADGKKQWDEVERATLTEKLLALQKMPMVLANWDDVSQLAKHAEAWIASRLELRIRHLEELLQLSNNYPVVAERLQLYQSSKSEVKHAVAVLRELEADFQRKWNQINGVIGAENGESRRLYEEGKKGIDLLVESLLISRDEGRLKLEQLNSEFSQLICSADTSLISRCQNLARGGSDYCMEHTCFHDGCNNQIKKGSRYCESHQSVLRNVDAVFPKFFKQQGIKVKPKSTTASQSTQNESGFSWGWAIFGLMLSAFVVMGFLKNSS